jgi:transcriptional regulator with PAS, ATPase and Fis domain
MDKGLRKCDEDCKYVLIKDTSGKVKGVFKKTLLKNMGNVCNNQHSVIKDIINRNYDDKKSEITINSVIPLKDAKDMVERELITKVMNTVKSTYKAAKILEVSQATIARKSKKYNDEISSLIL